MSSVEYVYSSLGKVVVAFQGLERSVEQLLFCSLTVPYSQFTMLVSEMSFKAKLNVLCSVLKELHSENDTVFDLGAVHCVVDEIRKNCTNCEEVRNRLVHSHWVPGFRKAPDLVMRTKDSAKSKKGYKLSAEAITAGGLDEEIELIESTSGFLKDLCNKLSIQYYRPHGMAGMSHCFDYEMLKQTIYNSVLEKSSAYSKDPT